MFLAIMVGLPGRWRGMWRISSRAVDVEAAARRIADHHRDRLALVEIGDALAARGIGANRDGCDASREHNPRQ